MNGRRYEVGLDLEKMFNASDVPHAHHTGWAWDAVDDCYVLTLHDEDDKIFACASYTFAHWMEAFERLSEARAAILTGGPNVKAR
ncbi:MAG TPA: hypothetical protein VHT52_22585 [Stellaceae bacterium]|jgi:hypothetical protein|nr:hypothetical protein [Stellaceae bacterium]